MFSNLIPYRIQALDADLATIEEALAQNPFQPCAATQESSAGWVPARGQEHGALVESVSGHWIVKYFSETKTVPAKVLERKVDEKAAVIEQHFGRKPGRKERRELKDEAKQELLPNAFSKQGATYVWIDPNARLLCIDCSSQSRADAITTALVEALPGLSLALLDTQSSPAACMALWLKEQEAPAGFSVDRECELKSADESKAVVRYARHPLDIGEVQAHIEAGKLPTRLALTWDDRVSLVLTEELELKKINFLDAVFEGQEQEGDAFDADVAIAAGELSRLIPALIDALGGEASTTPP